MRTGATIQTTIKMTVAAATITSKATFSPPTIIQHSPWHSPVPYLFGGLAAMLGLIAFALLILACSYWKLSGHMNNGENVDRDVEAGEDELENTDKALPVFEERIVVIMAGDLKPTFLATPMCSRAASSFEDADSKREKVAEKSESPDQIQKPKEDMGTHEPTITATTVTKNRETNENEASREQNQ